MEFDQILHMHGHQPDLGWNCSHIHNTVMSLGYYQNCISAQYLVNKLTEFYLVMEFRMCTDLSQF